MFTGIIQHLGQILSIEPKPYGLALIIDTREWQHSAAVGESIAVNGCCLTVADRLDKALRFDVTRQTLDVTALGDLAVGASVNLEHAVTPQTLLGGHIVQGHIDCIGHVRQVKTSASDHRLRIGVGQLQMMETIIDKGSIAVNGVSLTVAAIGEDWLEVALIPTTLRQTTLADLRDGDRVNLETDYIAKSVVNWLRRTRK